MGGSPRLATLTLACALAAVLLAAVVPQAEARPKCAGKRATIVGTPGNDVIKVPRRGRHVVHALGGNDRIIGSKGDDIICGGPGRDRIYGRGGQDRIYGGAGADWIDGGTGSDRIWGGGGDDLLLGSTGGDVIRGGAGDDRIYGENQDDRLFGGPGDDLLIGGHGSDELFGGAGSDWLRGDTEQDEFDGGPGDDTVSMATASGGVFTDVGGSKIFGDGAGEGLRSIENLVGSAFADRLYSGAPGHGTAHGIADSGDECIGWRSANCGSDPRAGSEAIAFVDPLPRDRGLFLLGSDEADDWRIRPSGGGIEVLSKGPLAAGPGCEARGAARVFCAAPTPFGYLLAHGGKGDDRIQVDGPFPRTTLVKLDGGEGFDRLVGGPSSELLLSGGTGRAAEPDGKRDVLLGGGGNDVLLAAGYWPVTPAILRGGGGADQLVPELCSGSLVRGGGGGPDIVGFSRSGAGVGIRARIGGVAVLRRSAFCPPTSIGSDIEILEGSNGPDILIGSPGADIILGRGGDDKLIGRGGPDSLIGGPGRDILLGGGGYDFLNARDGKRDKKIDCGPGGGRAVRDRIDPLPLRC